MNEVIRADKMTDAEFFQLVLDKIRTHTGDITHLDEAIGLIVIGRELGWRHQKLTSTPGAWKMATKLFGDLKMFLPEKGEYYKKSVVCGLIDDTRRFWDVFNKVESLPRSERRIWQR
jgi:hypothetical protein